MTVLHLVRADGIPMVKICGLRREEDLWAASAAGADMVGLVFAPSRRRVTPAAAAALLRAVPDHPPAVGVFVNTPIVEINAVAEQAGLSMAQLSGQEEPEALIGLRLPYLKTIHQRPGDDAAALLHIMSGYVGAVGFVLDSWSPRGGGSGVVADWGVAATVLSKAPKPVLLAGGLNPGNVGAALAATGATGVDVSSGVEVDDWKDAGLMRAFTRAARGPRLEIAWQGHAGEPDITMSWHEPAG